MTSKPRKSSSEQFELQPSEAPKQDQGPMAPRADGVPLDPHAFDPAWTREAPKVTTRIGAMKIPAPTAPVEAEEEEEGPAPSEKVDFENLPAFVAQRRMLRQVRNYAVIVVTVIVVIVLYIVLFTGKKTKDVIIEGIEKKRDMTQEPK